MTDRLMAVLIRSGMVLVPVASQQLARLDALTERLIVSGAQFIKKSFGLYEAR